MTAPIAEKIVPLMVGQKMSDPEEKRPIMLLTPNAIIKYCALSAYAVPFTRSKILRGYLG